MEESDVVKINGGDNDVDDVNDIISWWSLHDRVMQLNWLYFPWHVPDDATEGVAEQSSRLQPSINLHARVTAALYVQLFCSDETNKIKFHTTSVKLTDSTSSVITNQIQRKIQTGGR